MDFNLLLNTLFSCDKKYLVNPLIFDLLIELKSCFIDDEKVDGLIGKQLINATKLINLIVDTPLAHIVINHIKDNYDSKYNKTTLFNDLFNIWFRKFKKNHSTEVTLFKHIFYFNYNYKNKIVGLHYWYTFNKINQTKNFNFTITNIKKLPLNIIVDFYNNNKLYSKSMFNSSPTLVFLLGVILKYRHINITDRYCTNYLYNLSYDNIDYQLYVGYCYNNLYTFFFRI